MTFYKELGKKLREHHLAIDSKVEKIEKYQKYVNTELDYCHANAYYTEELSYNKESMPVRIVYPNIYSNSIKYNSENNSFLLKAGKTYRINANMRISTTDAANGAKVDYKILNIDTQEYLNAFGVSNTANYASPWGEKDLLVILQPTVDTNIALEITELSDGILTSIQSEISIVEISRQIVIDPLEHVNTKNGIEDEPVGHIISVIGNNDVKHYLLCNGTEYNISDYPYLAQYIENSFGAINYFGGDGENTFAVPNISHDGKTEVLMSYASTKNKDEEVTWTATKDCTLTYKLSTGNGYNAVLYIDDVKTDYSPGSTPNSSKSGVVELKKGQVIKVEMGDAVTTLEITAKTEERFYYIKYEPTYFMNVNNYIQPNNYSEEEKVVGCWTNGKPLYQKTIKCVEPKVTTEGTYGTNTSINIKNLNMDDGFIYSSYLISIIGNNRTQYYSLPYITNSVGVSKCYINNRESLEVCTNVKIFSNATVYITLQYTKTTDAENSFDESMLEYISNNNNGNVTVEMTPYTEEEITDIIEEIW